jgi:hypothetical protein
VALGRRISFPLRFAARRVAAARRPLSVTGFGVALASCALAVAFAAGAIVENRAVTDAIDELPPGAGDVEVSWVGLSSSPSERLDALDRRARAATIADRIVHVRDGRVSAESGRDAGEGESIVVGRGGWIRLPEDFPHRSRIVTRARARIEEDEIVISGDEAVPERSGDAARVRRPPADGAPVASFAGSASCSGSGARPRRCSRPTGRSPLARAGA